ncbi:MAG: hypothetical protein ACR2F6_04580 [Mycobacteriales bacterium]
MGYIESFFIPQRVNLHFAVGWTSACAASPMSAGDFGDVFHSAHDGVRRDVVAVNYVGVADERDADPYLIDPVIVDRATTFPAMKRADWRRRLKRSARSKVYGLRHRW